MIVLFLYANILIDSRSYLFTDNFFPDFRKSVGKIHEMARLGSVINWINFSFDRIGNELTGKPYDKGVFPSKHIHRGFSNISRSVFCP